MSYSNDSHASATLLSGASGSITPVHYDGVSDPASSESGEAIAQAGETLWWKWVAPVSGTATFTTDGSPSEPSSAGGLDTYIQVFNDTGIASGNVIAHNDDGPGSMTYGYNSLVTFTATAGDTYYVQVDQYGTHQVGTLHLAWSIVVPGAFAVSSIESYLTSLDVGVLLPGVNGRLYGTSLDDADTITFTGGLSRPLIGAGSTLRTFTFPADDLDAVHSGPAVISGPSFSVAVQVVILKPESPTLARTGPARTITGYLERSGFVAVGLFRTITASRTGEDLTGALASTTSTNAFNRDANFIAQDDYWNAGDHYPPYKYYGLAQAILGWSPGGFGNGLSYDLTAPSAPLPAGQYAIETTSGFVNAGATAPPLSDVLDGPLHVTLPLMALCNTYQKWASLTAEVYAVPASELASYDLPSDMDPWLPPSWFGTHTPLAVVDFGDVGIENQSAIEDVEIDVPIEYVWAVPDSTANLFTCLVVILKQYREDASSDSIPYAYERPGSGWQWIVPPTPSGTHDIQFEHVGALDSYYSGTVYVQFNDSVGTFVGGTAIDVPETSGTFTVSVAVPPGQVIRELWFEFHLTSSSYDVVLDWVPTIASSGTVRVNPRPDDTDWFDSGSHAQANLQISAPIQEPNFRFWVPESVRTAALRQLQRGDALAGGAPRQLQRPSSALRQGPGRVR